MSGPAAEAPANARYRHIYAAGIALLAALVALTLWQPRWVQAVQLAWFDTCQLLRPRTVVSTPVTVVEIDDRSIARFGQWPWPRTLLADLLVAVERARPLAIGVDILMPEPDRMSPERLLADASRRDPVLAERMQAFPSNDSELARAIAAGPVVLALAATPYPTAREPLAPPFIVTARRTRDDRPADAAGLPRHAGALTNIAELDDAASGHGLISAGSADSVIRRVPLVGRVQERLVPSLPIEMLRVALGAPEVRMWVDGASVHALAVGDFVAPTEPDGELRIYYSPRDPRRFVSAMDVLDGKVDTARFERKLVLIGTTGLALADYQNTPLGSRMPGTEIHAQVLENLFDQTWLTRPAWAPLLEAGVLVLLGLPLVWATPRWKPGNAALLAFASVALPLTAAGVAFVVARLVFDAATPAFAALLLFGVLLVLTLKEIARQRRQLVRVIQVQREQAAYVAGELEAAKRIQLGFLPRAEALRDERRIELAAAMIPAREVGGDLYDFFLLDEHRLFFMIGDVAGKGLSASMFMAVSKALCKSTVLRSPQAAIGALMRTANDELSRDNPEMFFVTAFAGMLDLQSGDIAYCNAGHDNPYLLSPASKRWVRLADAAGPPLCAVEAFRYDSGHRRMQPGELLCLVTDGVLDAKNPGGDRYGSRRLEELFGKLQQHPAPTAHALVHALTTEVARFASGAEAADDLTVLAWRWVGPGR